MSAGELQVAARFPSQQLAALAQTRLQAAGVETWIRSDDAGGVLPNLSSTFGVALLVRHEQLEAALGALRDDAPAALPSQGDDPLQLEQAEHLVQSSPRPRLAGSWTSLLRGLLIFALGVGAGLLLAQ